MLIISQVIILAFTYKINYKDKKTAKKTVFLFNLFTH